MKYQPFDRYSQPDALSTDDEKRGIVRIIAGIIAFIALGLYAYPIIKIIFLMINRFSGNNGSLSGSMYFSNGDFAAGLPIFIGAYVLITVSFIMIPVAILAPKSNKIMSSNLTVALSFYSFAQLFILFAALEMKAIPSWQSFLSIIVLFIATVFIALKDILKIVPATSLTVYIILAIIEFSISAKEFKRYDADYKTQLIISFISEVLFFAAIIIVCVALFVKAIADTTKYDQQAYEYDPQAYDYGQPDEQQYVDQQAYGYGQPDEQQYVDQQAYDAAQALAQLDEQYRNGMISAEDYAARRTELISNL